MSTILQALQKQQASQNTQIHDNMLLENDNLKWKAALLTALLVIICLLGVLIYMQFHPFSGVNSQQPVIVQNNSVQKTEKVTAEQPVSRSEKPAVGTVEKLTFVTKPLPEVKVQEPEQILVSALPKSKKQVTAEQKNSSNVAPAEPGSEKIPQELDYSEVSDDLQKRFKLAVLESQAAAKSPAIEEEETGDGSDINQMGYAFQEKVPAMSYDFHVYSTIVEDRWIRINGEDLREGQFDAAGKIKLIEIQPQRSIFRIGRQSFSLESLTDWKGY
ncbi:general secretion pathway protein GspB [Psychromonas ossibalaenae]|uniref:general secretion pathway protein GspB n=1 Tax=Psychromonas ossibalaenae TaxID=444922 RepID=UPI00036F0FF8|nr:general secretion pathway protein GspB [Psychromonas ossibalaenae]